MKKSLYCILLLVCSCLGCTVSTRTYDFSKVNTTNAPANAVNVRVQVTRGLKAASVPRSLTKQFTIDTKIIEGSVPGAPDITNIKLRFYHDWSDSLLTNKATLTLIFSELGDFLGIEEIPHRIGEGSIVIPPQTNQ